ncbi:MAG: hypothetical protein ABL929_08730 [Ferruginibacter sp.]|nr:hypothetical protein [Ferruginibacter sp.]
MRKNIIYTICFCLISFVGYTQNKKVIKSAKAFYKLTLPGMIKVNGNGQQITPTPSRERFIYIETFGKAKPILQKITYDALVYSFSLSNDDSTKTEIGIEPQSGKKIYLQPSKGNKLWKIYLVLKTGKENTTQKAKLITIKGIQNDAPFMYLIKNETELVAPESQ